MSSTRLHRLLVPTLALFAVAACAASQEGSDSDPSSAAALEQAAAAPCATGTDIGRSLAVTDATVLAKFSLARVFNRLRATAAVTDTNTAMYKRWFQTFGSSPAPGDCDDPNVDPNGYGLVCPRIPELGLAALDPFAAGAATTYTPVAIFNRFDLAPSSGAQCGEYRIVFALQNSPGNRAFLIFEASLPNPSPATGIDGCLPVARFWQGLSSDTSAASRAAKLEKFYFTGGAVAGFDPIVTAAHYGLSQPGTGHGAGQIRTNLFAQSREWQLREFKLQRTCTDVADPKTCQLQLDHVTVKQNPANELFAGTHERSADFRAAFPAQTRALSSTNAATIGMKVSNAFDEWESISQRQDVAYASNTNTAMRTAIQTQLTTLKSTLTVDNILDRATTQTCAGCHQVSAFRPLGGGVTWPGTLGFVHVDENKNLSPALTDVFLPHRKDVLDTFINARCGGAKVAAPEPGSTVGGSAEGAPN